MPLWIVVVLIVLLNACRPTQSPTQMAVTTAALPQGTVRIDDPAPGSVIYSEVVHISGTASGLPDERFVLVLTAPADQELARMTVLASEGQWQLDLLHGYNGVPSEVTVAAYPTESDSALPYDERIVAMAGLEYRPEGHYARLFQDQTTIGGDTMPIGGTASGLGDNQLTLRLLTPDGDLISEASISIHDPYGLNEIPWTADLGRNDYSGPALLELLDADAALLDEREVSVAAEAG